MVEGGTTFGKQELRGGMLHQQGTMYSEVVKHVSCSLKPGYLALNPTSATY